MSGTLSATIQCLADVETATAVAVAAAAVFDVWWQLSLQETKSGVWDVLSDFGRFLILVDVWGVGLALSKPN